MTIEDHEPFLKIIPPVSPGAKWEARCHLCSWSFHQWTDDDARVLLRTHIIDAHLTPIEERPFAPPDRRLG